MAPTATRTRDIPKSDPVMLRQVRRYVRRHGGSAQDAYEAVALGRISGPRHPEIMLAAAMKADGMNKTCVKMARDGYWSDFKSPLDFPKYELVKMLHGMERLKLADRVEAGEFDG